MSDSLSPQEQAFEEFARRAQDRWGDSLRTSLLLGSTARGGTPGVDSDVDVFVVVETEAQAEESLGLAHEVGFAHTVPWSPSGRRRYRDSKNEGTVRSFDP